MASRVSSSGVGGAASIVGRGGDSFRLAALFLPARGAVTCQVPSSPRVTSTFLRPQSKRFSTSRAPALVFADSGPRGLGKNSCLQCGHTPLLGPDTGFWHLGQFFWPFISWPSIETAGHEMQPSWFYIIV